MAFWDNWLKRKPSPTIVAVNLSEDMKPHEAALRAIVRSNGDIQSAEQAYVDVYRENAVKYGINLDARAIVRLGLQTKLIIAEAAVEREAVSGTELSLKEVSEKFYEAKIALERHDNLKIPHSNLSDPKSDINGIVASARQESQKIVDAAARGFKMLPLPQHLELAVKGNVDSVSASGFRSSSENNVLIRNIPLTGIVPELVATTAQNPLPAATTTVPQPAPTLVVANGPRSQTGPVLVVPASASASGAAPARSGSVQPVTQATGATAQTVKRSDLELSGYLLKARNVIADAARATVELEGGEDQQKAAKLMGEAVASYHSLYRELRSGNGKTSAEIDEAAKNITSGIIIEARAQAKADIARAQAAAAIGAADTVTRDRNAATAQPSPPEVVNARVSDKVDVTPPSATFSMPKGKTLTDVAAEDKDVMEAVTKHLGGKQNKLAAMLVYAYANPKAFVAPGAVDDIQAGTELKRPDAAMTDEAIAAMLKTVLADRKIGYKDEIQGKTVAQIFQLPSVPSVNTQMAAGK